MTTLTPNIRIAIIIGIIKPDRDRGLIGGSPFLYRIEKIRYQVELIADFFCQNSRRTKKDDTANRRINL